MKEEENGRNGYVDEAKMERKKSMDTILEIIYHDINYNLKSLVLCHDPMILRIHVRKV